METRDRRGRVREVRRFDGTAARLARARRRDERRALIVLIAAVVFVMALAWGFDGWREVAQREHAEVVRLRAEVERLRANQGASSVPSATQN